ncbi:MAG: 2-amino-4-hydroxy-6-hydroxymethyldihydropteridine diphosphokinase [Pyrinomonadaceae bacterium]|nr:2-amino-4-hydroxy-6-hydroxymethyldihydropteridine diphosphokinase [Pyrinomonadaceae bacterium]
MESEIITAYVGIGSNLGNRAGNLLLAVRGLTEASFIIHRLSAVYETEPVGVPNDQPNYLNMVAEIHLSNISPSQMMARMLRIEYLLGRRRIEPKAPRTVDLDLLLYENQIIETDFLTIPHPRMHLRNFVLVPFNEIAPQIVHPVLNQTIQEICQNSKDISKVERWKPVIEENNLVTGNS